LLELPQAIDGGRLERAEVLPPPIDRLAADAVLLATSGTDFSSASRRLVTMCSSVNRVFFMRSSWVEGAILSGFSWSEKQPAGQGLQFAQLRLTYAAVPRFVHVVIQGHFYTSAQIRQH
jgi:hypothetical protein